MPAFSFSIRTLISASVLLLMAGATTRAESVDELIKKGDSLDVKFKASEALQFYLAAAKMEPDNARILVRISRQYRHMMTDANIKAEKLKLGALALSCDERAAALAPNDSDAQLSSAITYGKMLPLQGNKEQVEASGRIKEAVDRAIKLAPRNDLAWHILGRWHRVLAGIGPIKRGMGSLLYGTLPAGSNEEAVKCFAKAIALKPGRLMHYIELGRVYAQMGQDEEARRWLEKGLAMPEIEKDDAESKRVGRETLSKLR